MRQASAKTFAATVRVRRRMAGAPFGRLDISDEGITVRSWFPAWIGPHSAPKGTITELIFYGWPAIYIKFTDDQGKLGDVAVYPVRYRRFSESFVHADTESLTCDSSNAAARTTASAASARTLQVARQARVPVPHRAALPNPAVFRSKAPPHGGAPPGLRGLRCGATAPFSAAVGELL